MKKYLLWLCVLFYCGKALAHPMPGSIVNLSVRESYIEGEAKIPLIELGNAVGDRRAANINDPFFKSYFTDHIKAISSANRWNTKIDDIYVVSSRDSVVGNFEEVVVNFKLTPPDARYLRNFTFDYDAVIHQVVTHSALVYVREDWDNGLQGENVEQQLGVIGMDVPSGKIFPLQVNLDRGSWLKGFYSMLKLGMQHIKEGTDHLLFLIALLLPAMLLTSGKQWSKYGGLRYSVTHLLKIVTAFTIGHSVTLLMGALGWVKLPGQPVEIMIAVSILVSAVHAMRPIFPGRETFIAAGFGLIHGLAFATVLSNLDLSAGRLALSILGFNLGIEVMQLFVIVLIVPWLILLSKSAVYKVVRLTGAMLAAIAALAWIAERASGKGNFMTVLVEEATRYSVQGIVTLAIVSLVVYSTSVINNAKTKFA